MTQVKWEEPQDNRLGAEFGDVAAQLKTRPGHWARVMEGLDKTRTQASSAALAVRRGKYKAFKPQGAFEAKSSGPVVWVRYVGENQEFAHVDDGDPTKKTVTKKTES